jgi:hypothetical protein
MTEREWLSNTNAGPMLEYLRSAGVSTDRRFRLFAAACCRRAWQLLTDMRSTQAVELGERYADGLLDRSELGAAFVRAGEAAEAAHWENQAGPVQAAAEAVVPVAGELVGPDAVKYVIESVAEAIGDLATDEAWEETWQSPGRSNQEAWAREQRIYEEAVARVRLSQAALLRDIVGNPFRPPSTSEPWRTPEILALAQAAYDHRLLPEGHLDPARLAVLADALEAAGHVDAGLVGHLRSWEAVHIRGCWAVDAILANE